MHKTTKKSLFTFALNSGGNSRSKALRTPEIKIYEIPPNSGGGDNRRGFPRKKTLQEEKGMVAGSGRGAKKSSMGFDNNQQFLLEIWELPWYRTQNAWFPYLWHMREKMLNPFCFLVGSLPTSVFLPTIVKIYIVDPSGAFLVSLFAFFVLPISYTGNPYSSPKN